MSMRGCDAKGLLAGLLPLAGLLLAGAAFAAELRGTGEAAAPARTAQAPSITARDLVLPGSQPGSLDADLAAASDCASCHAGLHELVDQPEHLAPYESWGGSMMAHAGRDPIFLAALDVANADLPGSGEFCLRCHMPAGWLAGRSGSGLAEAMNADDRDGVQCAFCHRMVDPRHGAVGPERDREVRAAITLTVERPGSGAFVLDPRNHLRGPRELGPAWGEGFEPHLGAEPSLVSPYHREAALCGSCHDIDNPVLEWDAARGEYWPGPADEPPSPGARLFPIERTYTEWRLSAFNPRGPAAGSGRPATCQDCHMRRAAAAGGQYFGDLRPREDLAVHDLTGASTWAPRALLADPANADLAARPERVRAVAAGIERARATLRRAARLDAWREGSRLRVQVTNLSGHKLPTGYVEGRRMWLELRGYDARGRLILRSGVHDPRSDALLGDPGLPAQDWQAHHGLSPGWAALLGRASGKSFHFVLNNRIERDDRIPPRGYRFEAFAEAGAAPYTDARPDRARYADGQHWDLRHFPLPAEVVRGSLRLWHQSVTADYVQFLEEANPGGEGNRGQILGQIWRDIGPAAPELMAERHFEGWQLWLPRLDRP